MGRIFWKFFFAFWLALLFAGFVVGALTWLHNQNLSDQQPTTINTHASSLVLTAYDIHQRLGDEDFVAYIQILNQISGPKVYVVNESGQELLQREVNAEILTAAQQFLIDAPTDNIVKQILFRDGNRYLIFVPEHSYQQLTMPEALVDTLAHLQLGSSTDSQAPVATSTAAPSNSPQSFPGAAIPYDYSEQLATSLFPPRELEPERMSLSSLIVIGSMVSFIFSWAMAWYFTRPIKILRKAFSQFAAGYLETRVSPKTNQFRDELTELGKSFDNMASQVQNLVTSQQGLLHDVSHELRSPLARMQAAIGIAQQQPDKVGKILSQLEKDSQRISNLVGELLLLAKLESGVNDEDFQEIDLCDLISEIVDDARFEAQSKKIQVYFNPNHPIQISARPTLLQRAIENIVRNAVKYADHFTAIYVEIDDHTHEDLLKIHIKDQGPGIPEELTQTIFQPFYRAQNKQNNDSIGLGLAIASRAIEAHGGDITAHNRSGGGLCVTIGLPYSLVLNASPLSQDS